MRLIAIGIAALTVNGTEYRCRVIGIHEGARTIINGFSANGHVVGVHHPVNKANQLPFGNQLSLTLDHFLKQRKIAVLITASTSGKCRLQCIISQGSEDPRQCPILQRIERCRRADDWQPHGSELHQAARFRGLLTHRLSPPLGCGW